MRGFLDSLAENPSVRWTSILLRLRRGFVFSVSDPSPSGGFRSGKNASTAAFVPTSRSFFGFRGDAFVPKRVQGKLRFPFGIKLPLQRSSRETLQCLLLPALSLIVDRIR